MVQERTRLSNRIEDLISQHTSDLERLARLDRDRTELHEMLERRAREMESLKSLCNTKLIRISCEYLILYSYKVYEYCALLRDRYSSRRSGPARRGISSSYGRSDSS